MSLVQGYSSDEDDVSHTPTNDVFGFTSLHAAKKPRVDEPSTSLVPTSAPDVLAEVCDQPPCIASQCTDIFGYRIHYTKLR